MHDTPPARRHSPARRYSVRGSSLIEVLIAVLIMGIGMLGIAAMQATALRNSQSSMERSQAVVHTYAILDAMRADRAAAMGGLYNTDELICEAPEDTGTLASESLIEWMAGLKQTLGDLDSTCAQVTCNGADCTVTVQWDDSRARDGAEAGSEEHQLVTQATL
jgi:type IV pilus assembly protein PilV